VHLLCQLLLHSNDAFAWLKQQEWKAVINALPDSEPLAFLLEQNGEALVISSLAAVLDERNRPDLSAYLSLLADEPPPGRPAALIQRWWEELVLRTKIDQRSKAMALIAASPDPSFSELAGLRKEILDLRKTLAQLPKLSAGDD
jgi:hypothetical protein